MQKSFRILAALLILGLGVWGWWVFFPGPERAIRSRLQALAGTVSFEPAEGNISRAYKAQKLPDFFTRDVEINVDLKEYPPQTFSGRDELSQAALWVSSHFRGVKVEFVDITVKIGPDRQTATANPTCKIFFVGDRDFTPQELNILFRKVDNQWLIYRVETVKTLLRNESFARLAAEGRTSAPFLISVSLAPRRRSGEIISRTGARIAPLEGGEGVHTCRLDEQCRATPAAERR